jgi:hypothetical protein
MIKEFKLKLTPVGYCCNPRCGEPLYKELLRERDQEACNWCDSSDVPVESVSPRYEMTEFDLKQRERDIRDAVSCISCGARYRRDVAPRFMDGMRCRGGCIEF